MTRRAARLLSRARTFLLAPCAPPARGSASAAGASGGAAGGSGVAPPPPPPPHSPPAAAATRQDFPLFARPYVLPQRLERGVDILHDPVFNKGTGFPLAERDRLGIRGLVPPRHLDIEEQAAKLYEEYLRRPTNLDKWLALQALQDRNETLFYKIIIDHVEETAPIIYTPTIGEVCLQYSRLYRRARGMFFSLEDRGNMHAMAYNWPSERVDVIVLTDGSRILGLGDLGVQGMGIPIGKLDLYVAGAGIHPSFVLPVCLDVGTDNAALRADSCYLGLPRPRLTGAEYYATVDELISALRTRWPNALLQFEDFSTGHALTLLERYRYDFPTFNDDIQGTAAVVLAGVYGALAVQGFPPSAIATQRFLVCGAGSAGMGITQALLNAMVLHGLSREEALSRFCVLDAGGVIGASRRSVDRAAAPYRTHGLEDGVQLLDAIGTFKPTALLGLSTVRGLFTAEVLRAMAALNARPLIFPLSNPTSRAECTCEEAALATDGRAIFGSGSPFADAVVNGRTVKANQGNNFYVFPGIGLGALLSGASVVSDGMLQAAAEALPRMLTPEVLAQGIIYPRVRDIRAVSATVAVAVMRAAHAEGHARNKEARRLMLLGRSDDELRDWAMSKMFKPAYVPLVPRPLN